MTRVNGPERVDLYVGSRVKFRRNLLGFSQTDLATKVGLTFQQVQKYETGTNRISASRLQMIADALDVPVCWFFEGVEDNKSLEPWMEDPKALELMRRLSAISNPCAREKAIISMIALVQLVGT
jgi:transcriptional regulator with XRE-family HTH domain